MRNMSKFGKISMKATALALAFVMSLPSASYANNIDDYGYSYGEYEDGPIVDNAKSVIDEAIEKNVPNAFIKHVFAEDETLGDVTVDLVEGEKDPKLKLTKTLNSVGKEGLVLEKVDTGVLARTKIDLGKYNFSNYKVDRVIYNMLAKKNLKGNAYLYLDKDTEPFVSFKIKRTADDDWEATKALTADVKEANLSGEHQIYLKVVADNAVDEDNKIISKTGTKTNLYFESMFFMEGSTPVLNFELDNDFASMDEINNSPTHTVEGYGDMHVEIPDGYESEYTTKPLKSETYELDYIRGRGNSTWLASKKPYKIKLAEKQNLFGMGKCKHWVLLANYYDYTLLRNRFTFDIAKKLGLAYTPDSVCVNVVIDGIYYGSYQLCEQIRVDEERVAIDDLEDDIATSEPDITGGYLINMGGSWLKDEEEGERITTTPYNFIIESPEYDENYSSVAKKKQLEYINNYFAIINKLVNDLEPDESDYQEEVQPTYLPYVINNVDDESDEADDADEAELNIPEGATWRDYMDEQSLIDYYLIQEFSLNGDSYISGSTYLYKPRNEKLYWGPVWDFDFVAWNATEVGAKKEEVQGYAYTDRAPWVARLIQCDAQFRENIVTRWGELKKILDEAVKDGGTLDKMADQTYMSALANYQVKRSLLMGDDDAMYSAPGDPYYYDENDELYTLNYYNEVERLKKFVKDRAEWVDETIDDIQNNMYGGEERIDIPVFADRENLDAFAESEDENLILAYAKADVYVDYEEGLPVAYVDFDTLPEAPAKEGLIFAGWYYLDSEGNECKLNEGENIFQFVKVEEGFYGYIPGLFAKYSSAEEMKDVIPTSVSFIDDTFYLNIEKEEWYDSYFGENEVDYYNNIVNLNKLITLTPLTADPSYVQFEVIPDEKFVEANKGDTGFDLDRDTYLSIYGDKMELTIIAKVGDKEVQAKLVVDLDSSKFAKVKDFTVDSKLELNVGDYAKVTPKLETEGEGWIELGELTSFYYSTTDVNVVEVSDNGAVLAKSAGEANVLVGKYIDEKLTWKVVNVKVNDSSKSDDNKKDEKKAPVKGTKLSDKIFTYKVTKAASDDGKKAGEVALTGLVKKNLKKANIKDTVTIDGYKYKVTSIASKAFKGAKKLTKVTIGKNVKKIGAKAFFKLKKLTKVTIKSKKLPKIGNKAFVKKGKKLTIKVNAKLKKKAKKALKKAKCKGVKVK